MESRASNSQMKLVAGLVGVAMGALCVPIIAGMIEGLDRDFEKGTAPFGAMVFQEVCGVLALAAVALVFRQLRLLWRGQRVFASTAAAVVGALALAVVWYFTLLLEFSS